MKKLTPSELQQLMDAFSHYHNAHSQLSELIGELNIESEVATEYPFQKSFDELLIDLSDWESAVLAQFLEPKPIETYSWEYLNSYHVDLFNDQLIITTPIDRDKFEKLWEEWAKLDDGPNLDDYIRARTNLPCIASKIRTNPYVR